MSLSIVVDAGVGIKLFVAEPDSPLADRLFAELAAESPGRFYVPDLFFVECANILWKYTRRFNYSAEDARRSVADLCALNLRTVATADLIQPALELALAFNLTAYGACYAALAQQLNLPLITADRRLQNNLASSAITVRTLNDLFPADRQE